MAEKSNHVLRDNLEKLWCAEAGEMMEEHVAFSYFSYDPPISLTNDRAGFNASLPALRSAFPDLRMAVEEPITHGERVVQCRYFRGTHRGEFVGIPATGKAVCIKQTIISNLRYGKVVEEWVETDLLGFLQQVGVVPLWN